MTQEQLGFGFDEMAEEQRTAHIPSTMDEAIPYFRKLIERHNAAMLAPDTAAIQAIRDEARDLAVKLNGGETLGILASDGPGKILAHATAAAAGTIPLWGQEGEFDITVGAMSVRIKMDGIFSLCSGLGGHPGFSANVIDLDKPFLSETGYRSFVGVFADLVPGETPDAFARGVCQANIERESKGKPRRIKQEFVEREMARRAETAQRNPEP